MCPQVPGRARLKSCAGAEQHAAAHEHTLVSPGQGGVKRTHTGSGYVRAH